MTMKTGNGRNLTMLAADKSVYHAQTHTFTITPEFEEWETKDTDGKEYELTNVAFTASVDGLVCIREGEAADGETDALDTPDMIAQALTGQEVDIIARIAIAGTTPRDYTTKCVIESFEVSESVAQKATYRASFKGYGLKASDTSVVAKPQSEEPHQTSVDDVAADYE